MNKIIEKQLKKTLIADLSHFDKESNEYFIPQYKQMKMDEDSCYLIQLDDSLLDSTRCQQLAVNFNGGSVPKDEFMKVEVCKTMGRLIYVDGVGYDPKAKTDLSSFWSGWLPIDLLTVIEKLV